MTSEHVDADHLEQLADEVRDRDADANAARSARDDAIRRALSQGMTAYRVAQVTGLSQPTVAAARDRAARA